MAKTKLTIGLAVPLLCSCATLDYDAAPAGEFSGSLFVMWVEEGGSSGDGKFVYVPSPNDPLTFRRKGSSEFQEIQPQMMYTDGGSIPRAAQMFKGFGPWGYAPAYMIHDWIFAARHCNLDGEPTAYEAEFASMKFETSAELIAESIKALIESGRVSANDIAAPTISYTVSGPISRRIWNSKGQCAKWRVSDDDRERAFFGLAGIGGVPEPKSTPGRELPDGTFEPFEKAVVVGFVEF
ncbi:hypothetical protein [Phaeobacter inhibens]|uniref:hypothetical protein n=1 Tax=Phaeobacter inhibens TaxID=221822 RepID=UPI002490BAE1|nr:hypothetical protein [Phaeobacter inhibens]